MPVVRRIVPLAVGGGVLFDILVPGNAAGLNAPLLVVAFLGAALIAAGRDGVRRMDPADAWLAPAALALAAMAVLRADDWLVTLDLLFAAALAAGAVGTLAGGRVTRGLVPHVAGLAVGVVTAGILGAGTIVAQVRRGRTPAPGSPAGPLARVRGRLGRAAPVARGLALAVPVVGVFGLLFASADAVFARLASDVLAWQPDVDLVDLAGRAMVVTAVAWAAAGLLGLGAGLLPELASADLPAGAPSTGARDAAGRRSPAPPAPPSHTPPWAPDAAGATAWRSSAPAGRVVPRLGPVEATTIVLLVDVLFAGFVALQLAYLFGGRDTLAMAGLTYAEYARRGFFELVLVAALAGSLVVALDLIAARRTRPLLGGSLALLGLTAIVLVSALVRLRLYQDAYGWTELRFVVLAATGWLAVALAVTAALLLARRTRWVLHALGIMVLVALAGMSLVGPQRFVTERNLERALDPSRVPADGRTGLDAGYFAELGDEAVVPILRAWDRLDPDQRASLTVTLRWRAQRLATDPELRGWAAWNLTRQQARDALVAWEAAQGTASR